MKFHVKRGDSFTNIRINEASFVVGKHWFWDEVSDNWELETQNFFSTNIVNGSDYLDIGGWIGFTAMMATALGAKRVDIVEPNPMNFLSLLTTQLANENLMKNWCLSNSCVSASENRQFIGPFEKVYTSSSNGQTSCNEDGGVEVFSLTMNKFRENKKDYSLIKIDIEGAEQYILEDLLIFSDSRAAIWLSLHPAMLFRQGDDLDAYWQKLVSLSPHFFFSDGNNCEIDAQTLKKRVLSKEDRPSWGTEWGNLFEIGLLPKSAFTRSLSDKILTRTH